MNTLNRFDTLAFYREQLRLAQRDAAIREAARAEADKLLKADPDYPDYPIHHDDWTAGNEHEEE